MRTAASAGALVLAVVLALSGCGKDATPAASSSAPAPAAGAGEDDIDAALNRYTDPMQMRMRLKADSRFKGFECAPSARTDDFGGRFVQCVSTGKDNVFIRLETYTDAGVGEAVDKGLSDQGWVVYPADAAAVGVAGKPELLRDVLDALGAKPAA